MTEAKLDPESLELRTPPRPVTRLNRRMLAVLAGTLSLGVLGITIWSLQPKLKNTNESSPELHNVERVNRAEGLDRLPNDYSKLKSTVSVPPTVSLMDGLHNNPSTIPQLGSPLPGELGEPLLRAEQEAGIGMMPTQGNFRSDSYEDAIRIERINRQREVEEAVKAPLFFRASRSAGNGNTQGASIANGAMTGLPEQANLQLNNAFGQDGQSKSQPMDSSNLQEHKQAFIDHAVDEGTRSTAALLPPVSPYQLMTGTIIPAALVTGINSDLPGQVIATVTESVFDTATGQILLIPQGSRLLGRYDSQVAYGQRRVLLVWTRLILPDASSIALDKLPGVDIAGNAGLEDGIDWHWDRIFAGAALSTLLGVGAELTAPDRNGSSNGVVVATRQSAQDTINQVGQEITKRNLSVQPTLTIKPGFPMRVIVNKDLVLKPYQLGLYQGAMR